MCFVLPHGLKTRQRCHKIWSRAESRVTSNCPQSLLRTAQPCKVSWRREGMRSSLPSHRDRTIAIKSQGQAVAVPVRVERFLPATDEGCKEFTRTGREAEAISLVMRQHHFQCIWSDIIKPRHSGNALEFEQDLYGKNDFCHGVFA